MLGLLLGAETAPEVGKQSSLLFGVVEVMEGAKATEVGPVVSLLLLLVVEGAKATEVGTVVSLGLLLGAEKVAEVGGLLSLLFWVYEAVESTEILDMPRDTLRSSRNRRLSKNFCDRVLFDYVSFIRLP